MRSSPKRRSPFVPQPGHIGHPTSSSATKGSWGNPSSRRTSARNPRFPFSLQDSFCNIEKGCTSDQCTSYYTIRMCGKRNACRQRAQRHATESTPWDVATATRSEREEKRETRESSHSNSRERKVSLRLLIAGGSDPDRRSGNKPAPKTYYKRNDRHSSQCIVLLFRSF